jgi:hypothetical protein
VIQHLRAQGRPGEGSIVYDVPTKLEPLLVTHLNSNSCPKWIKNEKVMIPKMKRIKSLKKTNHQTLQRSVFEHSKKFFIWCSIVNRVER